MNKKISAEIVADSINPQGNRITSYILTYPRFIHAELMTHRMFSRNSASSRAIPFKKMLSMVTEDPFIPIAWQKDHSGMQGIEYCTNENGWLDSSWRCARDSALYEAKDLYSKGVTKQLCNRLLEPFMWHTVLVTATEWDNFFELRCPKYLQGFEFYNSKKDVIKASIDGKDNSGKNYSEYSDIDWLKQSVSGAEIHIQALAEAMWDAMNESTPNQLQPGQWHIPFGDKINSDAIHDYGITELDNYYDEDELKIAVAVARCARLSYMTFNGEIDYAKDIALHNMLFKSKHMSPFEHVARCMTDLEYCTFVKGESDVLEFEEPNNGQFVAYSKNWNHDSISGWCNNFKGFIPYRYLIESR
jgi:thymidylate synthase ThyX